MTVSNSLANDTAMQHSRPPVSWPLIAFALTFIGLFSVRRMHPMLGDPDTYWHLAAGRFILETSSIPTSDPFSFTMPGAPWMAHEWLAEVVMAAVQGAAGWSGLLAVACFAIALTLSFVTRFLLDRLDPLHAILVAALTAGMLMGHALARPHVFAWPLIAIWTGTLITASEQRRPPPLWFPLLMVLWANLHGSFVLGVGIAFAICADAVWQAPAGTRQACLMKWVPFLAMTVAASLATPHGPAAWAFTLDVMGMKYALQIIGEWKSADFQHFQVFELWILIVLALAMFGHIPLSPVRTILLYAMLHLALKHSRNISTLGLIAPLLLATPLGKSVAARASSGDDAVALNRFFAWLAMPARKAGTVAVVVMSGLAVCAVAAYAPRSPTPEMAPEAALRAVRDARLSGHVLNSYNFGGYLIDQGIPVFIDGRADMYGDEFLKKYVAAVGLKTSDAFPKLLAAHKVQWTLLGAGTPAIAMLDIMPGWRRVYADAVAVVHARIPANP